MNTYQSSTAISQRHRKWDKNNWMNSFSQRKIINQLQAGPGNLRYPPALFVKLPY